LIWRVSIWHVIMTMVVHLILCGLIPVFQFKCLARTQCHCTPPILGLAGLLSRPRVNIAHSVRSACEGDHTSILLVKLSLNLGVSAFAGRAGRALFWRFRR